jgi:hypothetical protein
MRPTNGTVIAGDINEKGKYIIYTYWQFGFISRGESNYDQQG